MRNAARLLCAFFVLLCSTSHGQKPDSLVFPVKGFCIAVPSPALLDSFITFMNTELTSREINTLILRVDYQYRYTSHPELVGDNPLSKADVMKLAQAASAAGMRIIPQINLLGHQSWAGEASRLLQVYPQFDETPWIKLPEKYVWPNADSLYCKSYCPLHPDVHAIVFDLVDELCDAFGASAFHAGMDEVFYIGMDKCPRCKGKNKAELFAGEVNKIRDHLRTKNRELWIWGDRLLDGYTTGLGMWEASYNNTHQAIDLIAKDVMICDWHYNRADKTAVYFATKGFRVVTCPWNKPAVAVEQYQDMLRFRAQSTPLMRDRFQGMVHTVWSGAESFLREFYYKRTDTARVSSAETFRKGFPVVQNH